MPLVNLPTAIAHLRADEDDAKVAPLLAAAERFVVERLCRDVYATQEEIDAARAAAPAALVTARGVYTAASAAAAALADAGLRTSGERYAFDAYSTAVYASDRAQAAMLVNDDIVAAILLKLEELYEGTDTERAVDSLLAPHRAWMGV